MPKVPFIKIMWEMWIRNGPSLQRRRKKRADARKQAEEAFKKETTDGVDNLIEESNDVIVI